VACLGAGRRPAETRRCLGVAIAQSRAGRCCAGTDVLRGDGLYLENCISAKYGKYSPGAVLIDRITDELFAGPDTLAINSCAAEGSFMAYLWAGRRTMVDMLVDIGPENRLSIEWKPAGSLVIGV